MLVYSLQAAKSDELLEMNEWERKRSIHSQHEQQQQNYKSSFLLRRLSLSNVYVINIFGPFFFFLCYCFSAGVIWHNPLKFIHEETIKKKFVPFWFLHYISLSQCKLMEQNKMGKCICLLFNSFKEFIWFYYTLNDAIHHSDHCHSFSIIFSFFISVFLLLLLLCCTKIRINEFELCTNLVSIQLSFCEWDYKNAAKKRRKKKHRETRKTCLKSQATDLWEIHFWFQ